MLHYSHQQQQPKPNHFTALPHVVPFQLLCLRGPNPLFVAPVTLSTTHQPRRLLRTNFASLINQHFQLLPMNLNRRFFPPSVLPTHSQMSPGLTNVPHTLDLSAGTSRLLLVNTFFQLLRWQSARTSQRQSQRVFYLPLSSPSMTPSLSLL